MSVNKRSFVLLVDGDNAQPALIPQILEKVSEYGDILIKRVYGDWSQDQLKSWREVVLRHAFETPHRFNGSTNKNATDISLVIDAMDILWGRANEIDGFCIVSSDSDFTHLVARIRQSNLTVIGIGKKDTSSSFKDVCNVFITTEELKNPKSSEIASTSVETTNSQSLEYISFESLFVQAYEVGISKNIQNESGYLLLQDIRSIMKELNPESLSFVPQKMPAFVAKTKDLIESFKPFIEIQESLDNKQITHHIKMDYEIIKLQTAYRRVIEIYNMKDENDWITLPALTYAIGELYPVGNNKPQKILKIIKRQKEKYPNIVEFSEYTDGEEITHYIRIETEVEKFYRAYRDVINTNKVNIQDGWVTLSPIGSTVRRLYPDYQPLLYRGTKYSQLKKVIIGISQDYPNNIELKEENDSVFVRIRK